MSSESGHFKLVCSECKNIIAQCRCPALDKPVKYGLCDACQRKKTDGSKGELRTT